MNVQADPVLHLLQDRTLSEITEITKELTQDALETVSTSRTLMLRTLDDSFNASLARDLLLSSVSQAMGARSRLLFWTETNAYAIGLTVVTLGNSYTHGSVLLMELIDGMSRVLFWHDMFLHCLAEAEAYENTDA